MIGICSTSFVKNKQLCDLARKHLPSNQLKFGTSQLMTGKDLAIFLTDCEAALIGSEKIDGALLDQCKKLKIISKYGVGLDNIDLEACKKLGIQVCHSPGINAAGVAEHTLALILNLLHNVNLTHEKLKSGNWLKDGGVMLRGKTCQIVGSGNVGKRIAILLKTLGAQVLLTDILDMYDFAQNLGAEIINYESGVEKADLISYHVPLTEKTRFMFNKNMFRHLKKQPWIVNTSRGDVICEDDLIFALENQLIKGAALDVFHKEPLNHHKFAAIDRIILTPHIAGNSLETVLETGNAALTPLIEFFKVS